MRVRIKVCGMTRTEDVTEAARLGVDTGDLTEAREGRRPESDKDV